MRVPFDNPEQLEQLLAQLVTGEQKYTHRQISQVSKLPQENVHDIQCENANLANFNISGLKNVVVCRDPQITLVLHSLQTRMLAPDSQVQNPILVTLQQDGGFMLKHIVKHVVLSYKKLYETCNVKHCMPDLILKQIKYNTDEKKIYCIIDS